MNAKHPRTQEYLQHMLDAIGRIEAAGVRLMELASKHCLRYEYELLVARAIFGAGLTEC
jgi:hypothetical protein